MEKDGPERFCGKKTRHAGNYDMGKNRFMVEFNTDAQKFDIPMSISEWRSGQMLDLFHAASPRIKGKFHQDVRDCIQSTRTLIDPFGGVRIFNARMDEEIFKEGFANIPQRTVGHLVQGAGLKIDEELDGDVEFKWLSEDHDSLKMIVPENNWEPYAKLMKKYLEAPIDFRPYCSLRRDYTLVIPCENGNAYYYPDGGALTQITDVDFPSTNIGTFVHMDGYAFIFDDLKKIKDAAAEAEIIVTTEKDGVKLKRLLIKDLPIHTIAVDVNIKNIKYFNEILVNV